MQIFPKDFKTLNYICTEKFGIYFEPLHNNAFYFTVSEQISDVLICLLKSKGPSWPTII